MTLTTIHDGHGNSHTALIMNLPNHRILIISLHGVAIARKR